MLDERVRERLGELSDSLAEKDWLEGQFTAADLLMVTVLRRLEGSNTLAAPQLLDEYPTLRAYINRGKSRPAYVRAFEAQKRTFEESQASAR